MKKTNLNNYKGVTLIALVITIIIMLILVVTTINLAVNDGLFKYAGKATQETEDKKTDELEYTNTEPGMNTNELISKYTNYGLSEYADERWIYAWTYSSVGGWSSTYTQNNRPESFSGSVVAKVFEKDGGYHLIIEKIGENGAMGDLSVRSCSTMLAAEQITLKDSSRSFLIGWKETGYAWNQYLDVSLIKKVEPYNSKIYDILSVYFSMGRI